MIIYDDLGLEGVKFLLPENVTFYQGKLYFVIPKATMKLEPWLCTASDNISALRQKSYRAAPSFPRHTTDLDIEVVAIGPTLKEFIDAYRVRLFGKESESKRQFSGSRATPFPWPGQD